MSSWLWAHPLQACSITPATQQVSGRQLWEDVDVLLPLVNLSTFGEQPAGVASSYMPHCCLLFAPCVPPLCLWPPLSSEFAIAKGLCGCCKDLVQQLCMPCETLTDCRKPGLISVCILWMRVHATWAYYISWMMRVYMKQGRTCNVGTHSVQGCCHRDSLPPSGVYVCKGA